MNNDKELEDWIHQKVIYQSGVDYEGRPMLVLSACHFPDPAKVDYDLFYQYLALMGINLWVGQTHCGQIGKICGIGLCVDFICRRHIL